MTSPVSVDETIPAALQPEVDAALAWFNARQDITFKVTGIIDAETSIQQAGERRLRLILCGGDRCEQHTFLSKNQSQLSENGLIQLDLPLTKLLSFFGQKLHQVAIICLHNASRCSNSLLMPWSKEMLVKFW